MSDLAKLARSLHRDKGLTPEQIRHRSGFLDNNHDPYISTSTIQTWLDEVGAGAGTAAQPQQGAVSPSNLPPQTATPLDGIQQGEDHRALHARMAQLEAQLNRLSFERKSPTSSPDRSLPVSPERSRSRSPPLEDKKDKMIDQLRQMNTQLMGLVTAALGAADRRDPTPRDTKDGARPFKDWLPQVKPYAGETDRTPEAFLAQYYLYARQQNVPSTERTRQLIGKLTGPAQVWYTLTFANDTAAATESQIALGLRKAFGQEYAGVKALRAIYQVNPLPTQSGAQRLLALDHREEQARQHRVPRDAGPFETRFSRVLALFLPEELNHFLGELTADNRCSEEALRQLEETSDLFETPDAAGRASLAPTSPARETLFAARVQLAEAALRRIQAPSSGPARVRLARAEGPTEPHDTLEARSPAATTTPPQAASPPPTRLPDEYVAKCTRVAVEHTAQAAGTGFVGPPHYFGDNEDTTRKNQNQAELKRRRAAGYCFKCRMSDVKEVPFLECPLHGALATAANAPTVGRTKTHRAPRHT